MKESLLQKIWHHVFGYKYYLVISNRKGTLNVGVHENILPSKKEAKQLLLGVDSFQAIEIISFRSRERYITQWDNTFQRNINTIFNG